MAGRGTDIMLGDDVHELGGLYVIGTEKHESRRVDNQLRGRSGRQGDVGESRFILSIEDDMFRRYAKDEVEKFSAKMIVDDTGIIQNKEVQELIDRTQRIVEGSQYGMREYNLKLDDVINDQRTVLYGLRDKILGGEDLMGELKKCYVKQLILLFMMQRRKMYLQLNGIMIKWRMRLTLYSSHLFQSTEKLEEQNKFSLTFNLLNKNYWIKWRHSLKMKES